MRIGAIGIKEHLSPAQLCVLGMIAAHSGEDGGAILSKRQMSACPDTATMRSSSPSGS